MENQNQGNSGEQFGQQNQGNSGQQFGQQNQGNVGQQFNQANFNQSFGQQTLPNSTAILVLGIISIPVCICYFFLGIPGIVLGIIALSLSVKAKKLYDENPSLYTKSSYNNYNAGKICAIIGLIINTLWFLFFVIVIIVDIAAIDSIFDRAPF